MSYLEKIDELKQRAVELERQKAVLEQSLAQAEERLKAAMTRLSAMGFSAEGLLEEIQKMDSQLAEKVETFFTRLGELNALLKRIVSGEYSESDRGEVDRILGDIAALYATVVPVEEEEVSLPKLKGKKEKVKETPPKKEEVVEEPQEEEDIKVEEESLPLEEEGKDDLDDFDLDLSDL